MMLPTGESSRKKSRSGGPSAAAEQDHHEPETPSVLRVWQRGAHHEDGKCFTAGEAVLGQSG